MLQESMHAFNCFKTSVLSELKIKENEIKNYLTTGLKNQFMSLTSSILSGKGKIEFSDILLDFQNSQTQKLWSSVD